MDGCWKHLFAAAAVNAYKSDAESRSDLYRVRREVLRSPSGECDAISKGRVRSRLTAGCEEGRFALDLNRDDLYVSDWRAVNLMKAYYVGST